MLEGGQEASAHSTRLAFATALFLALVGLGMAIYLVSVRDPVPGKPGRSKEVSMSPRTNKGIIDKPSKYSVDETLARLQHTLQAKGVTVFALVDHSGEAEKVGMKMHPTKLVIFGNPRAGTPLMVSAPSVAIDFPLKILIWEDSAGKVWVSYTAN